MLIIMLIAVIVITVIIVEIIEYIEWWIGIKWSDGLSELSEWKRI